MIRADADPHQEAEIRRSDAVPCGRADDLVELLERIEAESADSVVEISLGDGLLGFHRVHEALDRFGQRLVDEANLGDRGDVVVRDPRIPQYVQQVG